MLTATVFAMSDPGIVRPNNEDAVMILRVAGREVVATERPMVVDLQ